MTTCRSYHKKLTDLVTKVDVECCLNKWLRTRNSSFLSQEIHTASYTASDFVISFLTNNLLESIVIASSPPVCPSLSSSLDYCNNGFVCQRSSSCSLSNMDKESGSDWLIPWRLRWFDYTNEARVGLRKLNVVCIRVLF